MFETILAAGDPITLAQGYIPTGNSGISAVDRVVAALIQIFGAIVGLGMFKAAATEGWSGGSDGKRSFIAVGGLILAGVGSIVLFMAIPNLIGLGNGILTGFIG